MIAGVENIVVYKGLFGLRIIVRNPEERTAVIPGGEKMDGAVLSRMGYYLANAPGLRISVDPNVQLAVIENKTEKSLYDLALIRGKRLCILKDVERITIRESGVAVLSRELVDHAKIGSAILGVMVSRVYGPISATP